MAKTLVQLVMLARQSADMEDDPLCDDFEVKTYVNDGLRDLYLAYIKVYSDAYLQSQTFTVAAGATTAPLPTGFLKSRGVDFQYSGRWVPVRHYSWRERGTYHSGRRAHRIDSVIRLDPEALDMSGTYRIWYYPTAPVLVNPADPLDGLMDQWSDFIVAYAASKMLIKAKLSPDKQNDAMAYVLNKMVPEAGHRDDEAEQAPDVDNLDARDDTWGIWG
jgi:hypothetical protein